MDFLGNIPSLKKNNSWELIQDEFWILEIIRNMVDSNKVKWIERDIKELSCSTKTNGEVKLSRVIRSSCSGFLG